MKKADFDPDLVMIYSTPGQLRNLLFFMQYKEGSLMASEFDPIGSCVHAVVPVILQGKCRITLPDPGDYERALAGDDEVIFSVPKEKVENLMAGLRHFEDIERGPTRWTPMMRPDFPRPEFYKTLFGMWGMDVEEE
jgi:uncharacterized protein (DUF169 family)